ncbi:hypothetical protein [Bifidobacterium aerophilum]|uniref:Uncharacterized protein n=1 Tax=Bifidobacterium aerophilum TaxID=1798155 RepID=A0A6N9Z244_9BIFI|nr:hypothetical protein [Bifidobacterium aerophilum]NEG88612.1 hypothetical protein [Bifidobacterium aerophilum]
MRKRILAAFVSIVMLLILPFPTAYALGNEESINNLEYARYQQLLEDGILGEDVSFDIWHQTNIRSARLEKELEESSEFEKVYDSNRASYYAMKAGDVFVTNATSSFGLTGHSGIAYSDLRIVHIAGPGKNPETVSQLAWTGSLYPGGWTKIYRHKSASVASAAANWARKTYVNSKATYYINLDLASTDKTYCSKLVWQSYYYGPSTPSATIPFTRIVVPYGLDEDISGISLVQQYG